MRRTFLTQIAAAGLAWLFVKNMANGLSLDLAKNRDSIDGIVGKWHLLDEAADEINVPQHRMDLLFKIEGGQIKGAILNRNTGEEIPLADAKFDGSTLQLQMRAPNGKEQAAMPTLAMKMIGGKFEGYWLESTHKRLGPKLKLVRARK